MIDIFTTWDVFFENFILCLCKIYGIRHHSKSLTFKNSLKSIFKSTNEVSNLDLYKCPLEDFPLISVTANFYAFFGCKKNCHYR